MQIPHALQSDDPTRAKNVLQAYFGDPYLHDGFTGASFDSWDSLGTRDADANVFTADDLIAVTLLSVNAGPRAAQALLRDRRAEFSPLLAEIGPDRDLADEPGPITPAWPAWRLENQLLTVHGIGLTIASKLIARKRPRLYPIWDTVVVDVLGTRGKHLASIHEALRTTLRYAAGSRRRVKRHTCQRTSANCEYSMYLRGCRALEDKPAFPKAAVEMQRRLARHASPL